MKLMLVRPKELPGNRPVKEMDYVVRPKANPMVDPITHMAMNAPPKRLVAEFRGMPPAFDSLTAQIHHGWTDEERLLVERHLLTHRDYGRGIYLFPGETLPPEYEALVSSATIVPGTPQMAISPDGYCRFVIKQFPLEVCGANALAGTELCEQHFREVATSAEGEEVPEPKPSRKAKEPAEVS